MAENRDDDLETEAESRERRAFLKRCGRFAAVTPPAMATLLVVSSVPKEAHASTTPLRWLWAILFLGIVIPVIGVVCLIDHCNTSIFR
jgi:hypothetical protein